MGSGRRGGRLLWALALLAAAGGGAAGGGCAREPDVLVLFVDTLRQDRVGCADAVGAMPSLEQFTLEGACFERVASTAGWTLPTQTSMLFSAWPEEHGVQQRHQTVADGVTAVTAPLADAGYRTALFSGNILTSHPQYQPYFDHLWVIERGSEFAADVDTQVVDEALAWLDAEAGRDPLFVVLQLYGPHYPYCAPGTADGTVEVPGLHDGVIDLCDPDQMDLLQAAEGIDPFPTELAAAIERLYDAEVAHTDGELTRFLAGWEALERPRERLTVTVTDHGEAFGEHGLVLHGRSLHRETSDCLLAFHGEGIPRAAVDRPVELLDLPPTLTRLLGLPAPASWRGRELSPLFDDPDAPGALRSYQVSSLLDATRWGVALEGEDGHRYRLLVTEGAGEPELYDATADPLETHDLAEEPDHAAVRARLEVLLDEMIATAADGGPAKAWMP